MSDLIPRAEMLRRVDERRQVFVRESAAQDAKGKDGSMAHDISVGLFDAACVIKAIPAIGTCATCGWAKSGRSPDGDTALECINRPFQLDLSMLGRVRIWVDPDHFCAAYKPKEGAK